MAHNTKSEIGNKYGRLTVVERSDKKTKSRLAYWVCECECGSKNIIVSGSNLRSGNTTSCGCYKKEKIQETNSKDEIGNTYGLLIVVSKSDRNPGKNGNFWNCKCKCGSSVEVLGCNLRNGHIQSCGCVMSIGEYNIATILEDNGIEFKKQIKFDDLRGKNLQYLRYDFGIYKDGELVKLIEFDGEQHYNESNPYYSLDGTIRDNIKNEYAKRNNIPLLRIPYSKRDSLTIQDLI